MTHLIKIKICGLTRVEDVKAVVAAGVDAVGFVFAASPRRISSKAANGLCKCVPAGVLRVGLFMDQTRSEVTRMVNSVPLDLLQFHGSESRAECNLFDLPYLKAVVMQDSGSVQAAQQAYPDAMGLLLDGHAVGMRGGSGKVFDWSLAGHASKPIWLAGGLNAQNVGAAIRLVRPFAVDVSSAVEQAPGIKDKTRILEFIDAVRNAHLTL